MRTRVVAAIVVLALGGAAVFAWPSSFDAEGIAEGVRAAGLLGSIGLFALLVVQCVVAPVPSEPIMMAAGYVYGPRVALGIVWTGVVVGGTLCFLLGRAYGRPLAERLFSGERLDAIEARLGNLGPWTAFAALVAIRALAFQSFDLVSYACGIVRLSAPAFLAATALGALPKAFAFTYAGSALTARPAWLDGLILAGTFGVLAVALVGAVLRRRAGAPTS